MRIIKNITNITLILLCVVTLTSCAMNNLSLPEQLGGATKEENTDLGVRYLFGRGVPQDNEKAFHYFKLAADKGSASAQNEVAYLYAAGKGTVQNYASAVYYYQLAAYQNVASAQYNLGLLYEKGLGVAQNQTEANKWIEKSAKLGFYPAKQYHAYTP